MNKKIKKIASKFINNCKESKEKAIFNIAMLILGAALAGLALYAIIYISRYVLLAAVLILLFCPGIYTWLDNRLSGNAQNPSMFPVYIGWDGCSIQPSEVEMAFKPIKQHFAAIYFSGYSETNNRIMYLFECSFRQDMPASYDLIQVIQKECEGVLARQCMSYGLDLPYSSLVVTDLINSKLLISFAKNEAGIRESLKQKEKIRLKYQERPNLNGSIYEEWGDKNEP